MNVRISTDNTENNPPMGMSMGNNNNSEHHNSTPMTVLSPKSNNIHNINNINDNASSKDKDQIFQLQIEIQSLKNKLKLSSSANKNELLELLSEKEHVVQTKTQQIQTLNDKFHKITKAVAQMEREVKVLRKDNQDMESDNKKLKRHLNIREKEVTALVTRCTAQEEKLAESKDSRIMEKEVKDLTRKLHQSQQQLQEMEGLKEALIRSESERDTAVLKIDKLTNEQNNLTAHMEDQKTRLDAEIRKKNEKVEELETKLEECKHAKDEGDVQCTTLSLNLNDVRKKVVEMNQSMQKSKEDSASQMNKIKTEKEKLAKDLKAANVEKEETKKAGDEMARLLKDEVQTLTTDIQQKEDKIIEMQNMIREVKNDHSMSVDDVNRLKDTIRSLEERIDQMTAHEKELVKEKEEATSNLMGDIDKIQNMASETEESYKEQIAKLTKDSDTMKEEYESMLLESESQFKEQDSLIDEERQKVEKLRNEIDQITAHSARQEELRKMEIKILEESLQSAKDQIKSKDKVIEAKVTNIKSGREKVAELESTIKILEDCSRKSEMDAANIVEELNLKLDQGTAARAKLEEERDRIIADSRKTTDELKDKISSLEEEFVNLKGVIVSKDAQLEQRETTVDSLMTLKEELEKKILSYRGDLETLMTAYDETKEEYSKKVNTLKAEMEQRSSKFESDYSELQVIATESQEELEKSAVANDTLERTITERNKTIEDLMNFNKTIEKEKSRVETMFTDAQNKWHQHLRESDKTNRYNAQMRLEKEKEANAYLDTLNEVKSEKEGLEHEVKRLQAKVEENKRHAELNAELKAENFLLQDKIDRQEAFLKRKIQKDKVKKERMIPSNPPLKSPTKLVPAKSSSFNNRSRSTSRHSSALDAPLPKRQLPKVRSASSSRLSHQRERSIESIELQRSASDELDDLLNDDGEI